MALATGLSVLFRGAATGGIAVIAVLISLTSHFEIRSEELGHETILKVVREMPYLEFLSRLSWVPHIKMR